MKKRMVSGLLVGCLLIGGGTGFLPAAFAGEQVLLLAQTQKDIEGTMDDQQRRIDKGILGGQLSRSEADTLMSNLNGIRGEYYRLRSDGRLSPKEVRRLETMLRENSDMIYKRRHNQIRRMY